MSGVNWLAPLGGICQPQGLQVESRVGGAFSRHHYSKFNRNDALHGYTIEMHPWGYHITPNCHNGSEESSERQH